MTGPKLNSQLELTARAEASVWITRLHGSNRSAEMEAGFQRWLAERPENAAEFEGLTEVWDLVGSSASVRGVPRLERWERSQEAQELKALRATLRSPARRQVRLWARAALVLLVAGLIALGTRRLWNVPTYSTDIGEQRVLRLADGSRVSLNSATRLVVTYRDGERRILLEKGEALFDVAKDPARPFVVVAGDHEVRALGTSFVVRYESARTAVTLVEGAVAVATALPRSGLSGLANGTLRSADGPKNHAVDAITLTPGQRLVFAANVPPKVETPRIEAVTAWRRGEVMLDDTRLVDAVAEMNRYDQTAIVIDDPHIDAFIVSGLYHTGDSEGFARSVARMYQLEVETKDGQIHLKR